MTPNPNVGTKEEEIMKEFDELLKNHQMLKVGGLFTLIAKVKSFLRSALTTIRQEERKKVGQNIIKIHTENGRDEEIALNDILNYADHLITGQEVNPSHN